MKKIALLVVLLADALVVRLLPAQSLWKGDAPSLQPAIMTYFQEEMTSLMRFQADREQKVSASSFGFWGFSIQGVDIGRKKDEEGKPIYDTSNVFLNQFGGLQIKLGDTLYLPLYAAWTDTSIEGYADEGTVKTAEGYPVFRAKTNEKNSNLLTGAGLYLTDGFFKGGVFAAYHYNKYSTEIQAFDYPEGVKKSVYDNSDENIRHSFKLAFLPIMNTSKLRYVGKILNNVLGYLGMGDMVEVFSGGKEDTDQGVEAIIAALNYALDLSFTPLEWRNASFGLRSFYRRDNYDAAARNDVYGGKLTVSYSGKISVGEGSFNVFSNKPTSGFVEGLQLSFECGFRHFNEVSPYFASKYSDTWFYDLSISTIFNTDSRFYYKFFLRYDDITHWGFGATMDWRIVTLSFDFGGIGADALRMSGGLRVRVNPPKDWFVQR